MHFWTVYYTTTYFTFEQASNFVTRYYKRNDDCCGFSASPTDSRGWPNCKSLISSALIEGLDGYESDYVTSACKCIVSTLAPTTMKPPSTAPPMPVCTTIVTTTSTFTRTATRKIASGAPSGRFTVLLPATSRTTSTTSIISISTILQATDGETTISLPPNTVTEYQTSQATTIATSTALGTGVPLSTASAGTVFAPRCDDARFLLGNLAFYPAYSGGYGSEALHEIDSASECCTICAGTEGCVSWFFDISSDLANALGNTIVPNGMLPPGGLPEGSNGFQINNPNAGGMNTNSANNPLASGNTNAVGETLPAAGLGNNGAGAPSNGGATNVNEAPGQNLPRPPVSVGLGTPGAATSPGSAIVSGNQTPNTGNPGPGNTIPF